MSKAKTRKNIVELSTKIGSSVWKKGDAAFDWECVTAGYRKYQVGRVTVGDFTLEKWEALRGPFNPNRRSNNNSRNWSYQGSDRVIITKGGERLFRYSPRDKKVISYSPNCDNDNLLMLLMMM